MAPHSNTLAWKIPWMEEPGGLQSMGSRRVGHDWATSLSLFTFMHWRRKWYPTSLFLPGESQGQEPGGLPSMGSHRVGHDWRDLAAAAAAVLFCNWVARMCVRSVAQSCWTLCDRGGSVVKNLPAMQEAWVWRFGFHPWVWTGRKWQPTPVFLPRKSHGQRSLVGYSP